MELYNIINVNKEDIEEIKRVYRNGKENNGDLEENPYNLRTDKNEYNTKLVKSETFFCDTTNKELINLVKKYIRLNEKLEYISNIHYINYKIGEEAKEHVDTGSSIRTYLLILNDDYTGGEFYLRKDYIPLTIGIMIEFDADMPHSVRPIKTGNREVLVTWVKHSQKKEKSLF